MRFKKGNIKNLTDAERSQYPYYNTLMKEYEGQTGQITRINRSEYVVEFPDQQKWFWLTIYLPIPIRKRNCKRGHRCSSLSYPR